MIKYLCPKCGKLLMTVDQGQEDSVEAQTSFCDECALSAKIINDDTESSDS